MHRSFVLGKSHLLGKFVLALVVLGALAVPAAPAGARVGDEDLRRAAENLERARSEAGAAGEELTARRAEAARLRVELETLADEVAGAEVRFAAARREARARVGAMYVAAGAGSVAGGALGTEAAVRRTYAAAVAARDQEVISALAAAAADRDRWRQSLQERAREQAALARRLEAVAGEAGQALAEAEAEYARVRAAWEVQEAERRAAEAAARTTTTTVTATTVTTTTTAADGPGATTTTTGTAPSTTTTTLPDPVEGGPFPPLVERWRPLVAAYFPAALVDEALAVMRCESLGDPDVVNPASGAAGLFQHMPRYWPERAAAAGFPGASPLQAEANIAATAWLVRMSLEGGLPAWYFWSCQP